MLLSWANVAFYQELMAGHARGHRRGPLRALGGGDQAEAAAASVATDDLTASGLSAAALLPT